MGDPPGTRHEVVYSEQNPNASIVWAVETPQAVVVGVVVRPYCGGAVPPFVSLTVRLPVFSLSGSPETPPGMERTT